MINRIQIGTVLAALAIGVTASSGSATAATTFTVNAPNAGALSAQVTLSDAAQLTFAVQRGGATVLSPSRIGIVTSAADLSTGLTFVTRADRVVTESYTTPSGKQRSRTATFTETTLSFTAAGGARLNVVVRVGADGAAYRYVLPATGTITVQRELSSWLLPTSAPAWLNDYATDYQGAWRAATAGTAATRQFAYPALFSVNNTFVSLAESDLDGRYSASRLNHTTGSGSYTLTLENTTVTSTGPLATPWRTAAVGDLATVTTSRLVDDVSSPSKIADTSWIRPSVVAWSWLTEHASPRDPVRQRQYVDFAQRNGWPAILIDEGWDPSWVPDVVQYARDRNVNVLLWFNSADLQTPAQRAMWLPLVKSWGVVGLKIDFIFAWNQATLKWYDTILSETAARQLMVNFHGAEAPRGQQRTWPHVMTSEAVFGAEQQQNRAALNTILPFTRNQMASMDFTPVTFSIGNRDTSEAHELATGLVFESGWQHFADSPENYTARPTALAMLDQLPTVWDETRLLGGSPGVEAYLARRNGASWYVGGISAVAAKTFTTPLSFLGPGQFLLETVRDGASAGTLVRETRTVTASDALSVPEATRGGFVSAICPFTAGMTTCARPRAVNLALNRPTTASTPCNANETGAKAVNGSVSGGNSDKWCSGVAGTKTLVVDLGSNQTVKRIVVQHAGAGGESTAFNTQAFTLATSTDGVNFTTVATSTANTASVTTSAVNVTARFIQLATADAVARIYELEAYAQ